VLFDGAVTVAPAPHRVSTPVLAVVLCLVWSSAFVFLKLALRDASAPDFAGLRALAAVPLLFVALLLRDRAGLLAALRDRRVHLLGLALGAVNVTGFLWLQTEGFRFAGIGFGAVLIYAQPLLVAGLAGLLLGERLRPRQLLGLATGWVGVGLTVLGGLTSPGAVTDLRRATLLFLGAAVCFALGTVLVKAVTSRPEAVPLPPALLLAFGYGCLPLLALGAADGDPVRWTPLFAVAVVYTGVVSLAGGYLLQFALLERGDAGVVSSYIFAVPVLTAVYGVVLLDEPLSAGLVAGAAAVAAGILLVTYPARRQALVEPP
jgi:drug/metabolite transporter (DMT)-like permease